MNNAGITTQYGFLFQRKAFILFALENAGTKQTFTFEGRDDIEISADESIYSVKSADASYIQVKSGTISESCFCKVICNWLLFDKESSGTVTLFAENQLDTLVSNITKDIIFDYIIQGKEKKRSSIAWKTYNKFQNLIETDREAFLGIIEKFLQIINIHAHPQYTVYTQAITSIIEEIEEEKVILSLTDYTKAVKDIEQEKQKLDSQIELLRSQATELTYEVAMKKVGLLEHIFTILSREINTDRLHELEIKTAQLKKEIKSLKSAFDQSKVKKFNNRLTELYLSSGLNIKHLKEDLQDNDFSLEFDPFRLCLFATHKEQDQLTRFMPGSMTRQTHLQMLTYLCMFEYLKDNFRDFIYLPILIIDSANQPMGIEIFKEVYPTITQLADSIGVQTIFMSKDRLDNIPEDDFIDISAGLNKFHKKS